MTTDITQANITFNESGTPYSLEFDDVYFSNNNGLEESQYVFVEGNNLEQHWQHSNHIHIAETGFGTGLNFFSTWLALNETLESQKQGAEKPLTFTFTSFEKFPLNKKDLTAALNCWPQVQHQAEQLLSVYPETLTDDINLRFSSNCNSIENINQEPNITLNIFIGDVNERILDLNKNAPIINAWYLDGFAPSKNPDMWTPSLFEQIAKSCCDDATLATFTAAGFVRRGLIDAGFKMTKRKGFGHKREMLVGSFQSSKSTQCES